jgi:hypothetical protein
MLSPQFWRVYQVALGALVVQGDYVLRSRRRRFGPRLPSSIARTIRDARLPPNSTGRRVPHAHLWTSCEQLRLSEVGRAGVGHVDRYDHSVIEVLVDAVSQRRLLQSGVVVDGVMGDLRREVVSDDGR